MIIISNFIKSQFLSLGCRAEAHPVHMFAGWEVYVGLQYLWVMELCSGHVHGEHGLFRVQGDVYHWNLHRVCLVVGALW